MESTTGERQIEAPGKAKHRMRGKNEVFLWKLFLPREITDKRLRPSVALTLRG